MTDAPQSAGLVALADRIELWSVDRLRPYERNPRTHGEAQADQIAASMVELGWTNLILPALAAGAEDPVLVDPDDGPDRGALGRLEAGESPVEVGGAEALLGEQSPSFGAVRRVEPIAWLLE